MMLRSKIVALIFIVLSALSSCRAISSMFDDDCVAEVNGVKLTRADLDKVIPKGLLPEDSVKLAHQYITSWATDLICQQMAEQKLSDRDKDVSRELEEYRKSLLKYRYEQIYVNERLDTSISNSQIEEYYNANKEKFVLERPIVKARYLDIMNDSPVFEQLKKKMSSKGVNDVYEADTLAYSSAYEFSTWDDEWIDINILARKYAVDNAELMRRMKGNWIESVDTLGRARLTYVTEMMRKGSVAPLEYCDTRIKDIIISVRKHDLLVNLGEELLDQARKNGQFQIY